jgi:hypothetical protein
MKKSILKTLVLLAVVLTACSDNDSKVKVKNETPLGTFMKGVEPGSVDEYTDSETYSVGYSFETKKVGKITALGVSAPQAGTYTVSLYDGVTEELLGTTEVTLTDAQIEAKPYGFQYAALSEAITTEVDQLFYVVYDMNSGAESIYRPIIEPSIFQMDGSFIEFQGGIWGYPNELPTNEADVTYYTADVKFTY